MTEGFLADLPDRQADRADAMAIVFGGRAWSWRWLADTANRVARALLAAGVQPGDRIALLDANSPAFFAVLFGALKARAALVPLNYRLSGDECARIVADAGARVLFAGHDYLAVADPALAGPAQPLPVSLDGDQPGWPGLERFVDGHPPTPPGLPQHVDDAILQIYTSGTTGRPKGVIVTQAGWHAFSRVMNTAPWARHQPGDRRLCCMPLYHVAGTYPALVSLEQGGEIVLTRQVDPPELVDLLRSGGITTTLLAPVVIQFLLTVPGVDRTPYPRLRNMSYGASPISESVLTRAMDVFGCDFVQVYGLTENMGGGTYLDAADHDPARGLLRSCGKPYPGGEARVVGPDDQPLPPGQVGEIQFRAPWNMAGYWNQPEATAASLAGSWLRTGDAGYFDDDGYLYVHDRIKDMIVTGGENVYPAEVENALFAHPAVADAAVIGVPDDTWGEAVKAVVVLAGGEPSESVAGEILEFLRARIAGYKVPKSVDFISALPRNASGKILKQALRAPYWPDGHRGVN